VIKQLIHKSGVNALAENQKIKFNSQVNVIYGLNGSGKSSYFRILNEMLGGENQTPIRPNIYRKDNEPVSVELKYLFRGAEKTAIWN
ncbi:AAA family ATPase, partial [Salmonella enterica]|uniref:AAA family ATPase n=1 Tax=Salmonella enterica TaxID=28901 RepID=UPI003CF700E3